MLDGWYPTADPGWWLAAIGILTAVVAFLRWVYPRWCRFWRRLNGTFDAIVGRESYTDPASGKEVDAVLPLTTRVAHVEEAIIEFRNVISLSTDAQRRISRLEERVETLEKAQAERIVTKAESAHMWRALADGVLSDTEIESTADDEDAEG